MPETDISIITRILNFFAGPEFTEKVVEIFDNLLNFLIHPIFPSWFIIIKILFVLFGVLLIYIILYGMFKSSWFKGMYLEEYYEFLKFKPFGATKTQKRWNKIIKRLELNKDSEYKLSILEADTLLSEVLDRMGYPQKTLEEKLEGLNVNIVPNLEELKTIREVRSAIINDPDYKFNLSEARKILGVYERALRDLQLID